LVYVMFFSGALLATVVSIYLLAPLAGRVGLIDRPCQRKQHDGEIPLVGGVCIFLAMLPAMFMQWGEANGGLVAVAFALMVLGAVDDRFHLSARVRLVLQLAAVMALFWMDVSLHDLGDLFGFGRVELHGLQDFLITAIVVVGVVNAVNMIDGVDGLAGTLMAVAATALCALSLWAGCDEVIPITVALLGALVGFLLFNLRHSFRDRAAIFLGDSGSMFIGFLLVIVMMRLLDYSEGRVKPVSMIWVLAVPLIDMGAVIVRRLTSGLSPMAADRNHLHHILMRHGLSPSQVVGVLFGAAIVFAAIGVMATIYQWSDWLLFWGYWLCVGLVAFVFRAQAEAAH